MRTLTKSRVFVVSLNALVLAAFTLWVWIYAVIYLGENSMAEMGVFVLVVPALLVFGVILLVVGRRFRIPLLNRLIPFIGVVVFFLYPLLIGTKFFPPVNQYLLNACIGVALSVLTIATTVSIVRSKQNGSQTGKVRWLPKEDRMSRRKSVGIVAASIIVAIAVLVISLSEYGFVGGFPDRNLGRAIRGALNKTWGAVDVSGLAGLRVLGDGSGIHNLSGLEYCTNLTELWLGSGEITDISPLASLTDLTVLYLVGNHITDISPLTNLTSLTCLDLRGNEIGDISPLANLTNLTALYLGDNQISNMSPLAKLTDLTGLDLTGNQISDISPLANLTNLAELYLYDNQISDIGALTQNAGLGTGDQIDLQRNPLSSDSINIYIPQLEAKGVSVSR